MVKIADLSIDWQFDFSGFAKDFVASDAEKPVMKLSFSPEMLTCHGVSYIDKTFEHFLKSDGGDVLVSDADWSDVTSFGLGQDDGEFVLPLAAICSRFSYYDALLVHASLVSRNGAGVLFVGYSGVGKTTQAELWQRYLGAEIINGDKAFLRNIDGIFHACGLPWKGSSEYCINKNVPLKAIVVLKQSDSNSISELYEKAELTMPHVFFPHWDKDCLANALDTFDKLLQSIPVYSLSCRPDEEAVMLTEKAVFG